TVEWGSPLDLNPYPPNSRIMLWFAPATGGPSAFRGVRSMEPVLAAQRGGKIQGRIEGGVTTARSLIRPAPRSTMFFPLVVLVAVLPGLYALNGWALTPPGPWWGLRGLAILDGLILDQFPAAADLPPTLETRALQTVAYQPPLYAWLAALGLRQSAD